MNFRCRPTVLLLLALASVGSDVCRGADPFQDRVIPFAKKYCNDCHNQKTARGELDLTRYVRPADVTSDFRKWLHVVEFIRSGQMPPSDKPQPTLDERNQAVAAIEAILLVAARKHAGDPGVIPPRRLSSTEFETSLRDLTGVTIRATAEFPPDPAGGEGFDNTGEALGVTPSLLNKYLGAAQFAAEHLVLKPDGITFAPFPVKSYNERKKLTEQAIIDFYRKHDVQIGDYLTAAWRYRYRPAAEREVTLAAWAEKQQLSAKYLKQVATFLDETKRATGYLKVLGTKWAALPAPKNATEVPAGLKELEQYIGLLQTRLGQKEGSLINAGAGNWPISHLAMRSRVAAGRDQFDPAALQAKRLLRFGRLAPKKNDTEGAVLYLRIESALDATAAGLVVVHTPTFSKSENPSSKDAAPETLRSVLEREAPELAKRLAFGKHPKGGDLAPNSFAVQTPFALEIPLNPAAVVALQGKMLLAECELDVKASPDVAVHVHYGIKNQPPTKPGADFEMLVHAQSKLAQELSASAQRFCAVFPNRFVYVDKNRGLAAGFHLVEGLFRDDRPLVEKVLNDADRKELERLWQELDFVTQRTEVLLRGFVWFERAERHVLHDKRFDFLRSEDPLLVEEELLGKFERVYLEKLGVKLVAGEVRPEKPSQQFDLIHGFFQEVRAGLATYNATLNKVEQVAVGDVERLAARAYGRALRAEEAAGLRTLYQKLRKQGQGVEDSLRGVFTAVLLSPQFFYHAPAAPPGNGVRPLADGALARRLSYFLWSSVPDAELVELARTGKLQDEMVLRAQVRRMVQDDRVEAFAREFFGQWLRYRDYLGKDPIPAGTFPGYNADLRQAMFEEPTRLLTHLLRHDQPVDEMLHSDFTFVNEALAKHYGGVIEAKFKAAKATQPASEWHRVDGLRSEGRGGLFGMPVLLAKNSAGQRTSPVKRGFWVVHHLLGQHFPPPPADVPELPKTEKESPKSIRAMLAQHTTNRQCAMCHVHFDGLGLTLEGFDAIGKARKQDLAGRPVETTGTLQEGGPVSGVAGLIDYVEKQRKAEFDRTLCRKFLGYALGRSVLLSDQPLLQEMEQKLRADRRFSVLFETVVLSPQFRQQRGRDYVAAAP